MDFDSLPNLVFDRTLEEAQRMQYLIDKGYEQLTNAEKQEWSQLVHRGSWDFEALNRIIEYLNTIVQFAETEEIYITLSGSWSPTYSVSTLIYAEDVSLLASDITLLRNKFYNASNWIDLNSDDVMTHEIANALEYDMYLLWQRVLRIVAHETLIYCNEGYCGEF